MKTQSATAHTLMTAKPHQVTRLFVGQASGQPHSQMGKVAVALSQQDCAIAKPVPGWYQRLKQNFLRFKTRPAHMHALADDSPSTFEPFAELFLLVMNDNAIHPTLRIWYSRLQWPVIQIATADPIGFQDDSHPARRLVVSLGEYALGQGAVELPCGALEQELKRLVLSIEDASVPSQSVFEQACKEFDEFLILTQTQPPVVHCSTCLQDQQQALTTQYQKAILNKLMSMPLQNATRDFLTQVWAEILAAHAVRKGLQHPDTLTLKHVAFELIQVSTDLANLGERRRAMTQVPQLVQQLRRGMVWMGIAPVVQNQHIQNIGSRGTCRIQKLTKPATVSVPNF